MCNFPEDETESIDVGAAVRVKLACIQRVIQYFWCQVAHGADAAVGCHVNGIRLHIMSHGQAWSTVSSNAYFHRIKLQLKR